MIQVVLRYLVREALKAARSEATREDLEFLARRFLVALYKAADHMSEIETLPATVKRARKDPRLKHD